MKGRNLFKIGIAAILLALLTPGCDVAYKWDIESGYDEYVGDNANVSIDTTLAIDVSMYDRARIFPGLVDTLAERRIADTTITLDLSKNYLSPQVLGTLATPEPIYSTGLYAGAGELVIIDVGTNMMGLSVQIGSHADDLTATGAMSREPIIYTTRALFPGRNYIRNGMGGYVWIKKQQNVRGSADFQLKFSNVYKAPDYVVDTDINPEQWAAEIRLTTVPWLELRGKRVAFSVSTARIVAKLDEDPNYARNMEEVLNMWDNALEKYYYAYYALTPGNSDLRFRSPEFPERVVLDVQLEGNVYMRWNGQPLAALNTTFMMNDLTDKQSLQSGISTNIFTAFGNNYAMTRSFWWSQMQGAANVIPLYRFVEEGYKNGNVDRIADVFIGEGQGINDLFPLALEYAAADSSKWFRSDPGTNFNAFALLPIVQLANYQDNDWAFYEHLNRQIKQAPFQSGLTFFFPELCAYFGKNFAPFFDHWGIDLPDAARAQGYNYPLLDQTIWKYDPLASNPNANVGVYDGSNYRYRHNRTGWAVRAFDRDYNDNEQADDQNGRIDVILDGYKSTRWHSWWRNTGARPLPFYIVIDMKNKQDIDGVFYANGNKQYPPSHMIFQTTDEEGFDLQDNDIEWYQIGELRSEEDMGNYSAADGFKPYSGLERHSRNEKYFDFIARKNIRYIRIVFPDLSLNNSALHTMGEFGTYYY